MQPRFGTPSAITVFLLLVAGPVPAPADGPVKKAIEEAAPVPGGARKAVERGLAFLQADAAKWRKERTCATCHHGTMTVWALSEARSRGYRVDDKTFRDVTNWTKERLANIDK